MIQRWKINRFSLWNACILAIFTAGCTTTEYPQRVVRKPVPTISDSIQEYSKPVKTGVILVRRGDSLYLLARRHGVALRGLIRTNKLNPPYVIHPGQRLKLPVSRYHVVANGQNVYQIAQRHGVDMSSLVRINKIQPPYRVSRGQRLRLPDSKVSKILAYRPRSSSSREAMHSHPESKWVIRPPYLPPQNRSRGVAIQRSLGKPDPQPIKAPPPRAGRKFLWPLRGRIIESFGARAGGLHNDGINIAARKGTSIRSAENGVVVYTGNQLQGFGNLVLVKHAGGWMSAYAHSSIILVNRGDFVRRGQTIARVGRTGNVSRPQLHFELRRGDRAVNPKKYLVRLAHWKSATRRFVVLSTSQSVVN
ncbi:M23 family metallopeptidase [Alphaproteobacteria bacterium]|nr:M23 family metallopeptidase [Alphaproteobacteria bacterium]